MIAFGVSLAQAADELKGKLLPEELKFAIEKLRSSKMNEEILAEVKWEELSKIVANDKGETLAVTVAKNLQDFLGKL